MAFCFLFFFFSLSLSILSVTKRPSVLAPVAQGFLDGRFVTPSDAWDARDLCSHVSVLSS
jgi:hypothetical protein